MHPVLMKTLGGLDKQYYFRQMFFSVLIGAFIFAMAPPTDASQITFIVVCTVLYPYSRFVYESVIHFIVGNNIIFANAFIVLFLKVMTMAICWTMALFIAPIGLAYLYIRHSRAP